MIIIFYIIFIYFIRYSLQVTHECIKSMVDLLSLVFWSYVTYTWWGYVNKQCQILTIIGGGVMSLPLGVLAQNLGSPTWKVNISQTRRPLRAYHIPPETFFRGESNGVNLRDKFNDFLLQNPRQCPLKKKDKDEKHDPKVAATKIDEDFAMTAEKPPGGRWVDIEL